MSIHCLSTADVPLVDPASRRVLWITVTALGVFRTRSAWPDALVAAVMSALAPSGAWTVPHHARRELSPMSLPS